MLPSVHPHVSVCEWIALIHHANAKQRPSNWNLRLARKFEQFALSLCNEHAVSGEDKWSLGSSDRVGEQFDLPRISIHLRTISREASLHLFLRWVRRTRLAHQRIFRDVHMHGTRPSTARNVECLCNDVRDLIRATYQIVVLSHRERDASDVNLLEGVFPKQGSRNVTRDRNHGNRVEHGGADPRDKICCTRTRRSETDADLPRCARVSICGMRRSLFVSDENVTQARVVNEHVIEGKDHAARIPPDGSAPLKEECLAECIGADAWAWPTATLNARITKHLFARALRGECRA